jgi:predicted amidohydrolase YtcJ
VRSFLDNDRLFSVDTAKTTIRTIEEQLLSEGYTMYMDGWSPYFFNDHFYQAARLVDEAGDMHFVLGLSYEIESWMDVDETLAKADDVRKYAAGHVLPNWVKLFMDGTVEGGTGFVDPLYPDGHQGLVNWTEEETADITRKANEKGLSMHIHTMGNKAVNQCVNAFITGGKDEMRNTVVHVRNVAPSDWQRMADHNIYATAGMLWHNMPTGAPEALKTMVPAGMEDKSYPMKTYFDHGINVSSHTDFPALSGCPDDPFGIMEIAVTCVDPVVKGEPWWPEEALTREQALTALTINCARQMFIEEERGSIREGKYADFLLVDRDVLSCPVDQIHTARPRATYFEGKKVFSR